MAEQRDIFNKLKAVQSAQSLPPYESPVSQSVDNMGTTDFLFELIKQTKGQEGLKGIVLKSTIGELNNNADISNMVFDIIREIFFCFFDIIIPESATVGNNGFVLNINSIDPTKMLTIDPNSPEGRHIYESNDAAKCLNYLIYTAFSTSYPDTYVEYRKNNRTLFTLSYMGGNEFKMFIGAEYAGQKLSVWAEDYLQDVSFFNMANFLAELVDIITGVVSVKVGKSQEDVNNKSKMLAAMKKLFGFCKKNKDNSNSNADNTVDEGAPPDQILEPIQVSPNNYLENQEERKSTYEDLFDFTPAELLEIEDIANLLNQGKVRFSTCGNFEVRIDPDDVFKKLDALFSDALIEGEFVTYPDPTNPSNTLQAQRYDNEIMTPDINNTTTFIEDVLNNNIYDYANNSSANEQGSPSANDVLVNLPNMKVEFEISVIKAIPYALVQMIISPQLMLLIKTAALVSGEEENKDVFTFESIYSQIGKFIEKLGDDIWNSIQTNIFNILVKDLTNLLVDLISKYLTQRFGDYINILAFIINLLKGFDFSSSGCKSMLDILMRLLSLNYFGPATPIPPPLVYAGGMLKPGLNQVSVVNDLKSSLADKGIETGAYMSDGTPNYLMAALETTTNTLIQHIKQDSRIDVMTVGTGITTGYAQIS